MALLVVRSHKSLGEDHIGKLERRLAIHVSESADSHRQIRGTSHNDIAVQTVVVQERECLRTSSILFGSLSSVCLKYLLPSVSDTFAPSINAFPFA